MDAEIDVAQLLHAIDAGEPLLLLDVRNEHDYASWRIEGRRPVETLHVPYFVFLEDETAFLGRLPRDRTIVAVCAQGGSSEMVAEMLRAQDIPAENLVGRAEFLFFSTDGSAAWWEVWKWPFAIRYWRLFHGVH